MHAVSAAELLASWEAGLNMDNHQRAVLLLSVALPEADQRQIIQQFSVGERDYYLFHLRHLLFGSRLANTAQCPQCQERLEWESDLHDLCSVGEGKYPLSYPLIMPNEHGQIHFRLPSHQDMMNWQAQGNVTSKTLLQRYVVKVVDGTGNAVNVPQLPDTTLQALSTAMEAADPLARIDINLTCPACGHQWQALFDIVTFLWTEIQAWAERTLRSVHVLATTYGWSEADILAMTPTRRQLYLGMVAQ